MAKHRKSGTAKGEQAQGVVATDSGPTGESDSGGDSLPSRASVYIQTTATDPYPKGSLETFSLAAPEGKKKRKSRHGGATSGCSETMGRPAGAKRHRTSQDRAMSAPPTPVTASNQSGEDKSRLPPEVWHHVFTFCPPKTLGVLLAVNRLFNSYLDPASRAMRGGLPTWAAQGVLRQMEANAIWQASRRLFWPQMPTPLRFKTELEMWRLACSSVCQVCGRLDARDPSSPPNPRHPGPGEEGVAVVWAFGSRMCGTCLRKNSVKEVELLLSPFLPAATLPALPFVFLTEDLNMFTATALEQGMLPPDAQISKRFSLSDVEALREEYVRVKDMGQGTVGEWLKGLAGRGSDLQHDSAKWEKWELSGGTTKIRSQLYPSHAGGYSVTLPSKPSANLTLPSAPGQALPHGRLERTAEQIADLKAARKAEIERRALLLEPPLTPDVLRHMPSFQAATHIVAPLDDDSWERLKPRLLAQRSEAQRVRDKELKNAVKPPPDGQKERQLETTLAAAKEARDRIDKAWEDVQGPLRAKIARFADDVIRDSWGNGKKVTKANCSRFAVDCLVYVRKRFYAEVAKNVAAAKAAGRAPPVDPPQGPFTQKLTLENLKWIFDTKIKPRTESLRSELFYCNGCEGNSKLFGLQSVIQHYAAKHTNSLSLGNIVVHWRAEWPEEPPFSATARPAKAAPQTQASDALLPSDGRVPLSGVHGYPPPGPAPVPPPVACAPVGGYAYTPPAPYNNYYQPPLPAQPPALLPPYQPPPAAGPSFAPPPPSYEAHLRYAVPPAAYFPLQGAAMPYAAPSIEPAQAYMAVQAGLHEQQHGSYLASSAGVPPPAPHHPVFPDLYHAKLEDIARNSREIWRQLGDIKDLPGSVRVYVTTHHVVRRFRSRFYETPPLTLFIDGLSNSKEMRPVRNVNGLVCKVCHLGLGVAPSVEPEKKNFSLPQLANHFQSKHVEPMQRTQAPNSAPPLDWVSDMVLLPDTAVLRRVASSATDSQRALLSAAIPSVFPPSSDYANEPSRPRQKDGQHGQNSAHGRTLAAVDGGDESRANSYAAARPLPAGLLGHNHESSGRSTHNATPDPRLWGGLVHGDDGGQNGSRDRWNSEVQKKREIRQGAGSARFADTASRGRHLQTETGKAQDTAGDVRVIRVTVGAEAMEGHQPSPRPETSLAGQPLSVRSSHQLERKRPVSSVDGVQEPGYRTPLELGLSGKQSAALIRGEEGASGVAPHADAHISAAARDVQVEPGEYPVSRHSAGRHWSPPRGAEFEVLRSAGRDGSQAGRLIDRVYHCAQAPIESREDPYRAQRAQTRFSEPLWRHTEAERRPTPPVSHPQAHLHDTLAAEADSRRYYEDVHTHARPAVEAYEIVHVIDEHGEYYIRRPVRQEPDRRYMYEERPVRRDTGTYAGLEPAHPPRSWSGLAQEGSRARDRPRIRGAAEGRPTDGRADTAAYYEEYDPRFPAA